MNLSHLSQFNLLQTTAPSFKQAQENAQTCPLQDGNGSGRTPETNQPVKTAASKAAVPELLKAYNGLPCEKTVSKEEVFDFLKASNIKREDLYEDIAASLAGKDGTITENAFGYLKGFQSKNHLIWNSQNVFKVSKEDGEINYRALKAADSLIKEERRSFYSSEITADRVLNKCKDKSGKFNTPVLDLFINHGDTFKQCLSLMTDYLFKTVKNNENEISSQAVSYLDSNLSQGRNFSDILTEIMQSKDSKGNFSTLIKKENDELLKTFPQDRFSYLRRIAQNLPDKTKSELYSVAKNIAEDKDFHNVLDFIHESNNPKNQEEKKSKTVLNFDEESVKFVRKFFEITNENPEKANKLISAVNTPKEKYTEETFNALKRLCSLVPNEETDVFLDAATFKAGANKGVLSISNLNKYLDIYLNRNRSISLDLIKYLSSCLSLEEDDRALSLFQKLSALSWSTNNRYNSEEKLNQDSLEFLAHRMTVSQNGIPLRKAHPAIIEYTEKLLEMKLPMESRDSFDNFIGANETASIEKLERVNFSELGFNPAQTTAYVFKNSDEKDLLRLKDFLKDYLKDKDVKTIDLEPNLNVFSVIEISTGYKDDRKKLLFDLKKGIPVTETSDYRYKNTLYKTQKDYQNHSESKLVFDMKKEGYDEFQVLKSQTFKKYDENWNLKFEETMEKSGINGVFNIKRTYPDGREDVVCQAGKDGETGIETIEKNMTSFDGTKSYYRYENDQNGNRILDYKIKDENGKTLLNQSVTFEVIDDNHFVSSRNNKKFDIRVEGENLTVKNLQTGESEKIELENFTKSTKDKLLPVLKKLPGEELMGMKKLDLKNLSFRPEYKGAHFNPKEKEIVLGEEFLDLAVLLHEWGHGKDSMEFVEISEEIYNDEQLKDIYNQEKQAFRDNFSDAQLSHIGYFAADYHYLGASAAVKEGIAETNTLLSTYPKNDTQSVRAHYWQQYFPKTIAYLAKLL